MMNRKHKYSLIIPVYNEIEGISVFMQSIYSQTISPDEIIIVDGGSSDGTYEYLLKESKEHHFEVFSFKSNIAEARNFAIKKAKYEIILCTDSGCKVDKNWCGEIIHTYETTNELVIGGKSDLLTNSDFSKKAKHRFVSPDPDFHFVSSRNISFYKTVRKTVGGYPEYLTKRGEDTYFNYLIEQKGYTIHYNPKAIVKWFMGKDGRAFYKLFRNYTQGDFEVLVIHHVNQSTSIKQAILINIAILSIFIFALVFPSYSLYTIIGLILFTGLYKRSPGGFFFDIQFSLAKILGLFCGSRKGIFKGYIIKKNLKKVK